MITNKTKLQKIFAKPTSIPETTSSDLINADYFKCYLL